MKQLLNHLPVPVHRGTTDITMIILAIDASTDTDMSTVRKGTEAGSMRLNGAVGMAIATIDMDTTRRAARPGNFGGPEKARSSDTGTRWTMFVTFCLLRVLFRVKLYLTIPQPGAMS